MSLPDFSAGKETDFCMLRIKSLRLVLVPMALGAALLVPASIGAATASLSALAAFHHVPPYPNHVLGIDIQSPPSADTGGSYVIKTSDSVAVVAAWYKQHLPELTSDKTTADGHHLFFTKNGSTVDVSKSIPFDGNYTIIGVVASK